MTGIALLHRGNMGAGLAGRLHRIVAPRAFLIGRAVVETCDLPVLGCMATVAVGRSADVRGRHAGRTSGVVAAATILGCANELAIQVAAFARNVSMGPCQREAGSKMVK